MTSPPSQNTVVIATRVMHALTGRRWTYPLKHVVEEYWVPETVAKLNLVGKPVSGVNAVVTRDGTAIQWELSDSFRLRFPTLDRTPWPFTSWPGYDANGAYYPGAFRRNGLHLQVDYVYGGPPTAEVQSAIDELAQQLDLAVTGGAGCKLPERVTNVAREGLTWTVLDPQQFLEGGKTGLYFPDLVISMWGNQVRARAKVYSPEFAPPRRLFSEVVKD